MANASISQIKVGNITYDICDVIARDFTPIGEKIYPIGSIYLSLNDTNPSILFGFGTWQALAAGYALWTSTDPSAYGNTANASNTGSTTLTAAQSGLPAHTHGFTNPKIPNHVHTMAHTHDSVRSGRAVGYNYGDITSGVNKMRVAAASSGTNYVPYVGNASVDFSGIQSTGASSAANTGNPTSLGATTGGAVGAVTDGAKAASSGHNHTTGAPARIYIHAWKRTA